MTLRLKTRRPVSQGHLSRRSIVKTAAAALPALAFPHVARAQAATLRITTWGGRWGETMKTRVLPAFETEFKCKVEVDSAFPFMPKLIASGRSNPVYDVLHANGNEQWAAFEQGLVQDDIPLRLVPNLKDTYPFATGEKVVGAMIFVNAIGLAYRTDKGLPVPTSWKDLADPRHAGARAGYLVPVNALGMAHLTMLGQVYGKGPTDLDAAFKALEALKPLKTYDFVAPVEKGLLSGELQIAVLHDSGVYRYTEQKPPMAFAAPREGVLALEQVLSVTTGSKVKELGHAYIDYMLRPSVQKLLSETVWYSPTNKLTQLAPEFHDRLWTSEAKASKLVTVDWRWYNKNKDEIDARYARVMRA